MDALPIRPRALLIAAGAAGAAIVLLGLAGTVPTGSPVAASAEAAAPSVRHCPPRAVSARPGVTRRIPIGCGIANRARARKVNASRARVVRRPSGGRITALNQHRNRIGYRARPGFAGPDRIVLVRRHRGTRFRLALRIDVRAPVAPLRCDRTEARTNYATPVEISITCTGDGLEPLAVAGGPFHGDLDEVDESGTDGRRTLVGTYTPGDLHVGEDALLIDVRDRSGAIHGSAAIDVLPWRMRAIGDSVTAGFGYFGDGSEMSLSEFYDCIPPLPVNNRCSSNSDERDGYDGPASWSADFGLANDVSWAAQFANGWQGGGRISAPVMFQNRAVTGSAPADWLPGGVLNAQLEAVVAENPDLIPMTMGANPLLSDILESEAGEECALESDTVAELTACIDPWFEQAQLTERLEELYTALLEAPDAEVVAFQYHLAVPSAMLFSGWQAEAMIDYLNDHISNAVTATKDALPSAKADRLTLIEAQVEPGDPDPQKLPRFNIGLPPDPPAQSWTPGYDCGELFSDLVDGPSHQSDPSQDELELLHPLSFCSGAPWIISNDTGIHPNTTGYAQFAAALTAVAQANDLIPELP